MRVIAGKARRIQLKTVDGLETRPTTDRIKETLFNMLQYDLYDSSFLDLFAGSGAIGIEALSRGCKKAVFVEKNPKAVDCIQLNLKATKLSEFGQVFCADIIEAINRLETKKESFDYIFMDPPYNCEFEKMILERLQHSVLVNEDTLIIVEASLDTDMEYVTSLGYDIVKEKLYKTNKHVFIQKENK